MLCVYIIIYNKFSKYTIRAGDDNAYCHHQLYNLQEDQLTEIKTENASKNRLNNCSRKNI